MHESALKDFSKAIDLDDQNYMAFYQRGLIYQKLDKSNDGLADFKVAITLNPDHEEALNEIIKIESSIDEGDELSTSSDELPENKDKEKK